MSALVEFAIFPTDKGDSVSQYVSGVIRMIRESGVSYKTTAMGTLIETDTLPEALEIVNKAYDILEKDSDRVYVTIKIDVQKYKSNRLVSKIESIENKVGKINK